MLTPNCKSLKRYSKSIITIVLFIHNDLLIVPSYRSNKFVNFAILVALFHYNNFNVIPKAAIIR